MFSGGFKGFSGFPFGGGAENESSSPQQQNVDNKTLYELLGLQQGSTTDEVKKGFRKKAIREHPDKGGDPEKFKKLTEAYEILSNPEKKDLYDRFGMEGVKNGGGAADMSDIFSQFFGGGGRKESGPRKMKARLQELEVTLEDVHEGKIVKFPFKRKRVCDGCEGKGGANAKTCSTCKGKGTVQKVTMLGPGMYSQSSGPCTDCRGEGTVYQDKNKCSKCKGNKVIDQEKTIEVPLEKGVPEEHDYQFYGEADEYPGVQPGDLYIRIKIKKHPVYERRGADLYTIKKISLLEALTGCQFTLKYLDGTVLSISTKPGEILAPSSLKTIKQKGMPFYKDAMAEGNLHIEFEIEMPQREELQPNVIEALKKILPHPATSNNKVKFDEKKALLLEDYDESHLNSNPEGGKRDEDEEESQPKGQRVQCAQQ